MHGNSAAADDAFRYSFRRYVGFESTWDEVNAEELLELKEDRWRARTCAWRARAGLRTLADKFFPVRFSFLSSDGTAMAFLMNSFS